MSTSNAESNMFEIDVMKFFRWLWKNKVIFISFLFVFIILAFIKLNTSTYKYRVELNVSAVQGGGDSTLQRLGALSSLAGVNLQLGGGKNKIDLYRELLQSFAVSEELAKDQALLQEMFPEQWNAERGEWQEPPGGVGRAIKSVLASLVGIPQQDWAPPGPREVMDYLKQYLEVRGDKLSTVIGLSILHKSPEVGKKILLTVNNTADMILRSRDKARAAENIGYLMNLLSTTTVTEIRSAIVELLSSQEKSRMMASVGSSYVAEIFSGPTVSKNTVSPQPLVVLIIFPMIGFFLATVTILIRDLRRKSKLVTE